MTKARALAIFCHKMHNTLEAGFDLERALLVLREEKCGMLNAAIGRTCEAVMLGMQLHQAMRRDEEIYTPELVNAVYVTEQTGYISMAFERMAARFERQDSTRKKILQASFYPLVVLLVLFMALFATVQVLGSVPPMLAIVAMIILGGAGLIILSVFLIQGGRILGQSSDTIGRLLVKMPFLGNLIIKEDLADLAGNMAVFYACGVAVDQGLRFSARSVRTAVLRDKILRAAEYTERGNPLSEALTYQGIFPADLVNSIRTGEASGNVDDMLLTVERFYRREIQNRVDTVLTVIRQ